MNPYRAEEQEHRARGNPNAYNPPASHDEFLLNDPLLRACWDSGLEANDVILALVKDRQRLLAMCQRFAEKEVRQVVVVVPQADETAPGAGR